MNVAKDVGVDQLVQVLLQPFGIFASVGHINLPAPSSTDRVDLQDSNRVKGIEEGHVSRVGNQVVDAPAGDGGSISSGFLAEWVSQCVWPTSGRGGLSYLQGVIIGNVGAKDVDIGTFTQFFRYLLFSGRLVSNEADDGIVRITGYLAKYLELVTGIREARTECNIGPNLHPVPWKLQ